MPLGDTGKMAHGTLRQTTISLPTVRESASLGLTLPTTEPGTPQISYTVQSTDVATFSGNIPRSVVNVPMVYACGRIGAAASVISYRILLNGVSQFQASLASIASGLYYTINFTRYIPVVVGDVITIALWSSQADTTFVYSAFTTAWTRLQLTKNGVIMKDVVYGTGTTFPTPTTAPTPIAVASLQNFLIMFTNNLSAGTGATASTIPAMCQETVGPYYLGRCTYGDSNNAVNLSTHATNQTNYNRNYLPSSITFREVLR